MRNAEAPAVPQQSAAIRCTRDQVSKAFTEWERDYRENPQNYMTPEQKAGESPKSYGDLCADFFLKMLAKVCNDQ